MTKPTKAFFYLVLFFTLINAGVFILAQFVIYLLKLNLILSQLFILAVSLFTGVIVALIISTTAPIFKEYMATYRRLIRLDNLSHPLLIDLAEKAPGTYYHSLAVANLAYRVAKELEINAVLVRVGAYFHDIGKIVHPEYFIENQEGTNPHDELTNKKSVEIIKKHVPEGITLAEEAGLPQEIINFIPEHTGTTLISYFYDSSKIAKEQTKKSEYQYPGPKPKSIESAIVMIADSLEAKLRLLTDTNKENIKQTIDDVIKDKNDQNQFSILNFNEKELIEIKKAFLKAASAQFHKRIAYPKDKQDNKFLSAIIHKKKAKK